MLDSKLDILQNRLNLLESNKDMTSAKSAIKAVVGLLVPESDELEFRLFRDSDGKLTANASWFFYDDEIADRRATYTLDVPAKYNLDIKVFGVTKPNMRTVAWSVGLTPNFEDEPFNGVFNVGIDFIVPESKDRVIVALSKNYVIRTIELKGNLTATFLEIFSNWLKLEDVSRKGELHSFLWNSLDLHPINKRFYEGISQRFIALRQHLEVNDVLQSHHAAQFANRLIGRIIFAWFLDKKALLDEQSGYFNSEDFADDTVFYKSRLEPLFFEVLNTPAAERNVHDLVTPYLNGGLFEPKPEDLYRSDSLTLPRNYFDDLFQFLRGYNFTTDESTSEYQQVAIDPEMLGRIFENLLAEVSEETGEQARKAKGAFYTPREIVDYMCRESLKSYLRSAITSDANFETRLYQLVEASEREFQDQDHNWRRDFKPYKTQIVDALDGLRVFDPACGSGAFPIGMMQLLVKVYARLESRFDYHKSKLAIIENNIYGADIEPMAVEISRLRAWLSLVVDLDVKQAEVSPLPNLDFKFVVANSLVGLAPLEQMEFFEDDELDSKLQHLRLKYFSTKNLSQKSTLRQKYLSLVSEETALWGESTRTSQLKNFRPFEADSVSPFFDPKHMFGFDEFHIVIGNPPYVRQEKVKYKDSLKSYQVYGGTADLLTYFFEKGLDILGEKGTLSLIVSSKFGRALYGEKLRKLLSTTTTVDFIVDHGGRQKFAAAVNTWIVQVRKSEPTDGHQVEVILEEEGKRRLVNQSDLGGKEWVFLSDANRSLMNKLSVTLPTLADFGVKINFGVKTGCNEAFIVSQASCEQLLKQNSDCSQLLFPVLKGKSLGRFSHTVPTDWILVTKNGIDIPSRFPEVAEFLEKKDSELEGKVRRRGDKGSHWMNLRDCAYYDELESEKIAWSDMSAKGQFSRVAAGTYIINTAYMLKTDHIEYLLGILNSSLVHFFMNQTASLLGGSGIRWQRHMVERIPIPSFNSVPLEKLNMLKTLVLSRENAQGNEAQVLENEIDEVVFDIYGLSQVEIDLIASGEK
jgi:hypothetical protein